MTHIIYCPETPVLCLCTLVSAQYQMCTLRVFAQYQMSVCLCPVSDTLSVYCVAAQYQIICLCTFVSAQYQMCILCASAHYQMCTLRVPAQ